MNDTMKNKLREAQRRYNVGDYKIARSLALALEKESDLKKEDRAEVERILKATGTDMVIVMALVFSLLLLVFLVLNYAF